MVEHPAFESTRPANYLLRLADSEPGRAYKALAADELDVRPGHAVADLGCGPGTDLPALARKTGPLGSVIGLDQDPEAVARARERVAALPVVSVHHADMHRTGLPSRSVDRLLTDRALQHVADPAGVLREVHRLLRPDGRAVFSEPDWDTLAIDYPDLAVPRAYRQFVVDRIVRNACIGRQLGGLAEQSGLAVRRVTGFTHVFRDAMAADRVLGFQRVTERAVSAGYLDAATADRWLESLISQPFFASVTLFLVTVEPRVDP